MNENHKLYIWINIKSFFKCNRIHIPCITFRINENSLAILICNRIDCRIKCHIRTENLMSLKCSCIWLCLSIELFTCKFDCKMQSTCTA